MNLNATLIGQLIAFSLFVWFCMKFVWPPLIKAIETRQANIADALAGEFSRFQGDAEAAAAFGDERRRAD